MFFYQKTLKIDKLQKGAPYVFLSKLKLLEEMTQFGWGTETSTEFMLLAKSEGRFQSM